VINDSDEDCIATGKVEDPASACPTVLTLQSNENTILWGEITIADGNVAPQPLDHLLASQNLLAPQGYQPTRYQACFQVEDQFLTFKIDTTTPRAIVLQIAQFLLALGSRQLGGTVADVQFVLFELPSLIPPGLVVDLQGCRNATFFRVQCSQLALIRSFTTEIEAWQRFVSSVPENLSLFQDIENFLLAFGDTLQEAWEDVGPILFEALSEGIDAVLDREREDAERDALRADQKVDKIEGDIRTREQERTTLQNTQAQLTTESDALQEERRLTELAIDECGTACTRRELKQLQQQLKDINKEIQQVTKQLEKTRQTLEKTLARLNTLRVALQQATEACTALQRVASRLAILARHAPLLGGLVDGALAMGETWEREIAGNEVGHIGFIACAQNDSRPACRQ
jgi:hypothetical protein